LILFVLYFDIGYYHWADTIIRSIEKFEPESKVYIHGYNLKPAQVEELYGYSNVIKVQEDKLKQSYKKASPHTKSSTQWSENPEDIPPRYNPIRFQITSSKGKILLDAVNEFPNFDLYVVLDVDMLLVRTINHILERHMKDKEVGVVVIDVHRRVKGGFIAIRNTKAAKAFIQKYNELVYDGKLFFQKDQSCLYKAYLEIPAKYQRLTMKYLYPRPQKAYIWSAHKSKTGTKEEKIKLMREFLVNSRRAALKAKNLEKATQKVRRIKKAEMRERRKSIEAGTYGKRYPKT
jgi:hypothetical protein